MGTYRGGTAIAILPFVLTGSCRIEAVRPIDAWRPAVHAFERGIEAEDGVLLTLEIPEMKGQESSGIFLASSVAATNATGS